MAAVDAPSLRAETVGGTEADFRLLLASAEYARSAAAMYRAAVAKFGDAAKNTALCQPGAADPWHKAARIKAETTGDSAVIVVNGDAKHTVALKQNAGAWRVDLSRPRFGNERPPLAAQVREVAKVMDRLAGDIADGQYDNAQQAVAAFYVAFRQPPRGLALSREAPATEPAANTPPKLPVAGYDGKTVDAHRQAYDSSCIPMSIELVLKLLRREPADFDALQEAWKNKTDGDFDDFDGQTIAGVKFRRQFDELRGNDFPTEDLFKTIDAELARDRYVIISLDNGGAGYHMYVIVGRTPAGDYHAVSKRGDQTLSVTNVKARIREMKGTDIMTYTIVGAKHAAS